MEATLGGQPARAGGPEGWLRLSCQELPMWEPMSPVSRSPEPKEAALMLRASAISSSDSASIASCAARVAQL